MKLIKKTNKEGKIHSVLLHLPLKKVRALDWQPGDEIDVNTVDDRLMLKRVGR